MKFFLLLIFCSVQGGGLSKELVLNIADSATAGTLNILANAYGFASDTLLNDKNSKPKPIKDDVTFWCRDRADGITFEVLSTDTNADNTYNGIDFSKSFVFLIHGWGANFTTKWVADTMRG